MGRNANPKIGQWDGGTLYEFRYHNDKEKVVQDLDCRDMIILERTTSEGTETLAAFYADGVQESLMAMYISGYYKGLKQGEEEVKIKLRGVLDVPSKSLFDQLVKELNEVYGMQLKKTRGR